MFQVWNHKAACGCNSTKVPCGCNSTHKLEHSVGVCVLQEFKVRSVASACSTRGLYGIKDLAHSINNSMHSQMWLFTLLQAQRAQKAICGHGEARMTVGVSTGCLRLDWRHFVVWCMQRYQTSVGIFPSSKGSEEACLPVYRQRQQFLDCEAEHDHVLNCASSKHANSSRTMQSEYNLWLIHSEASMSQNDVVFSQTAKKRLVTQVGPCLPVQPWNTNQMQTHVYKHQHKHLYTLPTAQMLPQHLLVTSQPA